MGGPRRPFLVAVDFLNKGNCDLSNPLWSKVLEYQAKSRCRPGRKQRVAGMRRGRSIKIKRCTRAVLMNRRARLFIERHGRPGNRIGRKVRTLKKLVPNSESMCLDSLFRETAEYIMALQMRVKAMQVMVNVLSGSE